MEIPLIGLIADLSWPDTRLVEECLRGNESAWVALIDKYKKLIFSIAIRRGFSREDATDVFQTVAAQLLSELARIRQPEALAAWLIQVTSNKCTQWQKQQARYGRAGAELASPDEAETTETPESLLLLARREQTLRYAVRQATPQCRQLIRLLFFENPPLPYPEVAASLGLATGSVGFVRKKCLDRLRVFLREAEF